MNILIFNSNSNSNIARNLIKKFLKNSKIKKIFAFDIQPKPSLNF